MLRRSQCCVHAFLIHAAAFAPSTGIGAESVNIALKALSIARSYLKVDPTPMDLSLAPSLDSSVGPDVLLLAIKRAPLCNSEASAPEDRSFRVAGGTQPGALGGAIATKLREGARFVSVTSVGPAAALRSIKSIALAASFVEKDRLVLSVVPTFVDLKMLHEGEEVDRTGLRMDVFVSPA